MQLTREFAESRVKALLETGRVANAAAIDLEGNTVFALPVTLSISKREAQTLLQGFLEPEPVMAIGAVVGGVKYMTLRVTAELIVGKHGTSGVACFKASNYVLVGIHDEKSSIEDCMELVSKIGKS